MADRQFEELEHTADAGLRVFGDDLGEVLVHAARGMFSLIGHASFAEEHLVERRWEIDYATAEEALLRWLQALLLEFDLSGFFPVTTAVEAKPGRFAAVARGGTFDPARHELRSELKAVTRHGLCVRHVPRGGLEAEVIFDL